MLVCNVSLRPPRTAISAAVAEAITAADAISAGSVLAVLVDDPASATDSINAILGQIMLEAASATDTVSAGGILAGAVVEAASAADTADAAGPVAAAVVEAATAASVEDGSVTSGVTAATYDGLATNTAVSNGNLTVLHNSTATNSGCISTAFESSGKYYFEVVIQNTTTASNFLGIMLSSWNSVFSTTNMTASATSVQLGGTGTIYSNGGTTGKTLGATAVNDVYSAAIDLTGKLGWFRKNGGNWNGDVSANPATGTGGVTIASGSFAPIVRFAASTGTTDQMTGNFGQSAFAYTAPSGFGTWPA